MVVVVKLRRPSGGGGVLERSIKGEDEGLRDDDDDDERAISHRGATGHMKMLKKSAPAVPGGKTILPVWFSPLTGR